MHSTFFNDSRDCFELLDVEGMVRTDLTAMVVAEVLGADLVEIELFMEGETKHGVVLEVLVNMLLRATDGQAVKSGVR